MPAPLHLACHALLGLFTAWHYRHSPSAQHHLVGWPLLTALAWASLLLVPVATFQARMYPCHAACYVLSPELQPELFAWVGPITLGLVGANLTALGLGYALARLALARGHTALLGVALWTGLVGLAATSAWAQDRVFTYGSTHAFWAQQAAPFGQTPSAWCCLLAYAACATGIVCASRWARLWPTRSS